MAVLLHFDDDPDLLACGDRAVSRWREAEPHGKGRAPSWSALNIEPAAMTIQDVLHNRQAEAGAPEFA
jgi:hypothetical protein